MPSSWVEYYKQRDPGYSVLITTPMIAELIAKVAGLGRTLIEFGYGTGYTAIALANRGKFVTAYDLESGLLDHANAAKARYSTKRGLVTFTDQFSDLEPVDVVYSQGLLEHFSDEKIIEVLRTQLSLAKVAVVFSVPSERYPQIDFGDERLISIAEWEGILAPVFQNKLAQLYYYGANQHLMGVIRK